MKAAVLREMPGRLEIEEFSLGDPGPLDVRLRIVGSGLCHSELHMLHGNLYKGYPLPAILGHEVAGVVEQVGELVVDLEPGDHVIACPSVFCGRCEHCLTGHPNLCQTPSVKRAPEEAPHVKSASGEPVHQFAQIGGFAEETMLHRNALVKIDPEIPLDLVSIIGCAVVTGMGAVFHSAQVRPGSTVAVIGAGGVGLNTIQGARIAGAARIIAVDLNETKLELARKMGATDTINPEGIDLVGEIVEMTGGGVHYAFEVIGFPETIRQAYSMLRRGGTAVVIGVMPDGVDVTIPGRDFIMEKRLIGSMMGSNRFLLDVPEFLTLYQQGRLDLESMVSKRISLDEVNEGYAELEQGETARSVIVFN